MPPRWFCSRACNDFHDVAVAEDAARSLDDPAPRAGCRMREAAADVASDPARPRDGGGVGAVGAATPTGAAGTEDLWHLLFDCQHPAMRELREDMRVSAISHYTALCESIVEASDRAERWYPGDSAALADSRAAAGDACRVVEAIREAGAALEPFVVYRLILALPFPQHAVPDRPPPLSPSPPRTGASAARGGSRAATGSPFDDASDGDVSAPCGANAPAAEEQAVDPFAASRALGCVYDSVRLTNTLLRSTATLAVSWASGRIRAIADARRAVLFPPPPRPPPLGRPAGCGLRAAAARSHDDAVAGGTADPPGAGDGPPDGPQSPPYSPCL